MTTTEKQRLEKLEKRITELETLVSGIIPYDNEGAYRPEFIREVKRAMREKQTFAYTRPGDLLKHIRGVK